MTTAADRDAKMQEVRKLMKDESIDCLLVTQTHNFAWLTGGRSFVASNTDTGVSSLFIDQERAEILTTTIEEPRMKFEECQGFEVTSADWRELPGSMEANLATLANGRTVEKDTGKIAGQLEDLQVKLTVDDVSQFKTLGNDCGHAIEQVARKLVAGVTEYAVAGEISKALLTKGIDPVAIFVAFDKRILSYRHPIPTDNRLEQTALLVLCGRARCGLIASVSRVVNLGKVSTELRTKHDACARVDAEAIMNTIPGKTAEEMYDVIAKAYEAVGFGGEIAKHHQGGITGYKGRYWKAQPGSKKTIGVGVCYAWNPSIAGTKSEDTIYLPNHGGIPEVITASPTWPMINVTTKSGWTIKRPDILVLGAAGKKKSVTKKPTKSIVKRK